MQCLAWLMFMILRENSYIRAFKLILTNSTENSIGETLQLKLTYEGLVSLAMRQNVVWKYYSISMPINIPLLWINMVELVPFLRSTHKQKWSDIHGSIKLTNGLYWESSAYLCQRKHPGGTRRLILCLVCCLVSLVDSLQNSMGWQKESRNSKLSHFSRVIHDSSTDNSYLQVVPQLLQLCIKICVSSILRLFKQVIWSTWMSWWQYCYCHENWATQLFPWKWWSQWRARM